MSLCAVNVAVSTISTNLSGATARRFSVPEQGGPSALKKALLEVLDWFPRVGLYRLKRKPHSAWREVHVSRLWNWTGWREDKRAFGEWSSVIYWWSHDLSYRYYQRSMPVEDWLELASRGRVRRLK